MRLFAGRTVGKVGGEKVDGLTSSGVEIAGIGSVGTATVVANRE